MFPPRETEERKDNCGKWSCKKNDWKKVGERERESRKRGFPPHHPSRPVLYNASA